MTQSMVTERMPKTLCPTWDQTLIFGDIEIHGKPRNLERHPPDVYIELFDHDTFVSCVTKQSQMAILTASHILILIHI